jgi:hypothetical protein
MIEPANDILKLSYAADYSFDITTTLRPSKKSVYVYTYIIIYVLTIENG